MQYTSTLKYKAKTTVSPFFSTPCLRWRSVCTGVKACKYLVPELQCSHTQVDEAIYSKIQQVKTHLPKDPNSPRQKAIRHVNSFIVHQGLVVWLIFLSVYQAVMKRFNRDGCPIGLVACRPTLREKTEGVSPKSTSSRSF